MKRKIRKAAMEEKVNCSDAGELQDFGHGGRHGWTCVPSPVDRS